MGAAKIHQKQTFPPNGPWFFLLLVIRGGGGGGKKKKKKKKKSPREPPARNGQKQTKQKQKTKQKTNKKQTKKQTKKQKKKQTNKQKKKGCRTNLEKNGFGGMSSKERRFVKFFDASSSVYLHRKRQGFLAYGRIRFTGTATTITLVSHEKANAAGSSGFGKNTKADVSFMSLCCQSAVQT